MLEVGDKSHFHDPERFQIFFVCFPGSYSQNILAVLISFPYGTDSCSSKGNKVVTGRHQQCLLLLVVTGELCAGAKEHQRIRKRLRVSVVQKEF